MKNFEYLAPRTLREAVRLLAEKGEQARVLAGGTDLIVQMRNRRRQPERVVDIKNIPDLTKISYSARKGLRIGAAVPCQQIYRDAEVIARYPGLVDAAAIIGGIQIQGRATLGGNLCNSSPSGDSIPALIVHGAVAEILGPEGPREVPVAEFCTGPGRNVLRPGELLVALRLPAAAKNSGGHYLRFIPRNEMDIAVVGVGASVELANRGKEFKSARIALGAVAPTPLFASQASELLAGKPVSDEVIAEAAEAAKAIARPITDMRGTAEFRLHLVGVLTRRALQGAVKRARGEFVANAVQEAAG
ncbi:MAG: FAD binding domain-containing protein [Candidatus Latescibacteria bacterium]|nr:FAD binding domain-containing protein [Candidatus Latescibacterota bacterium]